MSKHNLAFEKAAAVCASYSKVLMAAPRETVELKKAKGVITHLLEPLSVRLHVGGSLPLLALAFL